jgi:hypothetical protein
MSALLTDEGTQARTTPTVAPAEHGGLRSPWHRILLAIREMNYASRRVVELQAPWSVDQQWKSR